MKMKRCLKALVAAAVVSALLAGCANGGAPSAKDSAKPGDNAKKLTAIKIAAQFPLSGGSAAQGEPQKLGAQMSLEDQKAEFEKLGFDLQYVPYDDQGDPKKGAANAELIGADPSILGVVGHYNSGVTIPSSVIYEKYNLVDVVPSSVANDVTSRGLKSVARVVARDGVQGPAAAEYVVKTLGAKNILIVQDKTAYGQGVADVFKKTAENLGAKIVGYESITVGDKDFSGTVKIMMDKKPDFVFYGGVYLEGGLLIKQAREKGITVPFMSGAGFDTKSIIDIAGDAIKDTYYYSTLADIGKSQTLQQWNAKFKEKFGKNAEGYAAYGYDSMSILLNGIKSAISKNGGKLPSREQVREAVRATKDYQGIATKVSFDDKGDNSLAKVFIYKFDGPAYPGTFISELGANR